MDVAKSSDPGRVEVFGDICGEILAEVFQRTGGNPRAVAIFGVDHAGRVCVGVMGCDHVPTGMAEETLLGVLAPELATAWAAIAKRQA